MTGVAVIGVVVAATVAVTALVVTMAGVAGLVRLRAPSLVLMALADCA
jgi:hypothetical protein